MPDAYRLIGAAPAVGDYLLLRERAGLSPMSRPLVADTAVLPQHQRRGIGDAVLAHLFDRIRVEAPPGAYVSLLADPPGRRL